MESTLALLGPILLFLLPVLGGVSIYLTVRLKQSRDESRKARAEGETILQRFNEMAADNAQLAKYRAILDVDAQVEQVRAQIREDMTRSAAEVQATRQAAQEQVAAIQAQATQDAARIVANAVAESQRAHDYIGQAQVTAHRIIQDAQNYAYASHNQALLDANAVVGGARQELAQAQQYLSQVGAESARIIQGARDEAVAIRKKAEDDALATGVSARSDLEQARQFLAGVDAEAKRIVDAARMEAQTVNQQALQRAASIADDAVHAADQARQSLARDTEQLSQLQGVIAALKNQVSGYGMQYVVPTSGLLDELSEEFGFDEAGRELKKARDASRAMAKYGTAGQCDYVETNRSTTAIAFVVDAFNGKVDTILADLKHDNFGVLGQKIRDAFHLVNQLGSAFRNARITQAYLDARLAELRWGAAVHELRMRLRDEQRVLKERIREEERAQREFERARKDALKEEESLTKALDKARKDLEKAGAEQRERYELQIGELTERLKAAEERNQRALSMAQQTRAGHVYVISNIGSFGEDVFKIGMTRRLEPLDRVRELGDASVPFEFDVHALLSSDDAPALENALHKRFLRNQVNKVNARKEFFRAQLSEIRLEVERLGISGSWTLEAACRQFRETQAIERAMEAHLFDEEAWARTQLLEHEQSVLRDEVVEVEA